MKNINNIYDILDSNETPYDSIDEINDRLPEKSVVTVVRHDRKTPTICGVSDLCATFIPNDSFSVFFSVITKSQRDHFSDLDDTSRRTTRLFSYFIVPAIPFEHGKNPSLNASFSI